MAVRPLLIVGTAIFVAVLAFTLWGWTQIPDGVRIAVHWNLQGQPNGFMNKAGALAIGPTMMAGVSALLFGMRQVEPRQNNLVRSNALFAVAWIGTLCALALVQAHVVFAALRIHSAFTDDLTPAIAIFFLAIGNVLGKTRSNFMMGIRTPWSLDSDYSWEKTHRWAGRLIVLTSIATLASGLAFGNEAACKILLFGLIASIAVSVVLSYFFWRQDPFRHGHDSLPE